MAMACRFTSWNNQCWDVDFYVSTVVDLLSPNRLPYLLFEYRLLAGMQGVCRRDVLRRKHLVTYVKYM
jgi:hypothetical protein